MRRSAVVRLTLLPMLATAAVASADASDDPPSNAPGTVAPSVVPDSAFDGVPPEFDTTFAPPGQEWRGPDSLRPPGMTEPVLAPPGMTPPLDCEDDPEWDERPECTVSGGVIRGGFGHYFWVGGG